jgi:hypothetical protein
MTFGGGDGRGAALAVLAALAMAGAAGCSNRGDGVTQQQSALTVPVPPIAQFAVMASRNARFDDRTQVLGGSVGVAAGASNTLTAGAESRISEGRLLLSPRVVLEDHARTGEIGTNSFNPGADNTTGPVSAYEAPPTQPTPGTITPGTTPITVPLNGTRTLAPGAYGAVLVNNNGTLNLSGGLYQFQSLTVHVESRVNALASTTLRVATTLTGLDRSRFLPSGSLGAVGFRIIVGGATNAVTLGNDVQMTALLVARGDVRAGDRYIFTGAIAGRDVIIGHDCRINAASGGGFQCANNAHCNDNNTCTTDVCNELLCTRTPLPNNTVCNDSNACTLTDRCNNAVCVGSNPVTCVALDQCHNPGVCAPATGLCSNPNKPNGTTCSDGDTCTSPDACSAGVCVGTRIVNCGVCPLPDTDGDGVKDCTDQCPRDPLKTSPGICDCGIPDTDSDTDGVPDCIEGPCKNDPHVQKLGQCGGCGKTFAAAGTRCTDGPCNGTFTCDGAGRCGSTSQCPNPPQPEGCVSLPYLGKTYWFCPGPTSWTGARDGCKNLQAQLVEIEDEAENVFVNGNKNASTVWIGGNNRTAAGTWRWATAAGDDGNVFWTGGAAGMPYFARYANWAAGSPDASEALCASMSGPTWVAGSCTASAGYVCEVTNNGGGGEIPDDPDDACKILGLPCPRFGPFVCTTTEAAEFGGLTEAQVHQRINDCNTACADHGNDSPECAAACQPPIEAPPATSTCPAFDEFALGACALKSARTPTAHCSSNAECLPGEICGVFTNCPPGQTQNCASLGSGDPPGSGDPTDPNPTDGTRVCGVPADGCPTNDPAVFPAQCDETVLCDIEHPQDTPGFDPGSDLTSETFVPQDRFPTPDAPSFTDPYPALGDPCPGSVCNFAPDTPAHPWCRLGVSDGLTPRPAQSPAKAGRAGGGQKVSFNFDPRLNMSREMALGPLGIPTTLSVRAEAGLTAVVVVDSSIAGGATVPILDANAALNATRCGVNSQDTRLTVLGMDFMPLVSRAAGSTFPFPLSQPSADAQATCEKAFTDFVNAGDRAKKALRDAVELLRQYNLRVGNTNPADNFSKALCNQIAAHPPRGFPAGSCGTESPEDTINRFIDYYTRSVIGFAGVEGAKGLAEAAQFLSGAAFSYYDDITLYSFHKNEEITVFQSQFFVGPIPVSLELLATMDYGATIAGRLEFKPGSIIPKILQVGSSNTAEPLASVSVGGVPNAGAGLALFAGVGFSVNGFTAKIGIEGTIHLGDVFIDAHAGSGVGLGAEPDDRGPPTDFVGLVSSNYLIPPKRLVGELHYEAGLGAGVRDVLSGDIAVKLKIKIAFFSKTWRKRLLSFKGFCARPEGDPLRPLGAPCDVTLVSAAGTTTAASGDFPWGAVRAEMPFPVLNKLMTPAPEGVGTFSSERVEQFFYDSLCTCINNDLPTETRVCFRNDDCCPAKPVCFSDAVTPPTCIACRGHAQSCRAENGDGDCCPGQQCVAPDPTKPNERVCSGPLECNAFCENDNQCAHDLRCDPDRGNRCWAAAPRCEPT